MARQPGRRRTRWPVLALPGVDRTLVLLAGNGVRLEGSGDPLDLRTPFELVTFTGEADIDCILTDGPVRDFNLMVRRDAAAGEVIVVRDGPMAIAPALAYVCYAASGISECLVAGYPPLVVAPEHSLVVLVDPDTMAPALHVNPTSAQSVALVAVIGPARQRTRAVNYFAPSALLPDGWSRAVAIDVDAAGRIAALAADASAEGRETLRGPGRAGDAQPAFARVPACARGTHGSRGARQRRQLLDMAAGDVRVPRSRGCGGLRGDRSASLCGDGTGRLRERRRIPLCASRSRGQTLRRCRGARMAHRRRRGDRGTGAHPAARVLRARRIRRPADDGGAAAFRTHDLHIHAFVRPAGRPCRRARLRAWSCAAQPACRHRRGAGPARAPCRAFPRRFTSTRPSRRAKSTNATHATACARSSGCLPRRTSIRAGAWCTRRT